MNGISPDILNFVYYFKNTKIAKKIKQGYCVVLITDVAQGEVVLFFQLKKQIEKYFNIKIFPVLMERYKAIVRLCNYKDDLLYIHHYNILPRLACVRKKYGNLSSDWIKTISIQSPHFKPSDFYVLSPYIHRNRVKGEKWFNHFKSQYEIPLSMELDNCDDLNRYRTFINKIKYKKTILLCPEAGCQLQWLGYELLTPKYINKLAANFKAKGYDVIYNKIFKDNRITQAKWIKGSVEQIVEIASCCHRVVSLRSGICDILHGLDRKLIAISYSQDFIDLFDLNYTYKSNVREFVYDETVQNPDKFAEICLEE